MHPEEAIGVMGADYAHGRVEQRPLNYRFRVRAQAAFYGYRSFHDRTNPSRVLDLGAADGLTMLELRRLFGGRGEFVGIELSDELLAAAPPFPPRVSLLKGDVTSLPESVRDESFELCTALALLEHLSAPEVAVQQAMRALKPGGVFVATCPKPFWDQVAGRLHLVEDDFHAIELCAKRMQEMLTRAGFVDVVYRPFMWVVTGFLPYLGFSPPVKLSLFLDSALNRVGLMRPLFANQLVLGRKPAFD